MGKIITKKRPSSREISQANNLKLIINGDKKNNHQIQKIFPKKEKELAFIKDKY